MNHFEIKDIFIIIGTGIISYIYHKFWSKFFDTIIEKRHAQELEDKRK